MNESNTSEIKSLSNLSMSFEENLGQKDEQVRFLTRGRGYTAFFTPAEVALVLLQGKPESSQLDKQEAFMQSKLGQEEEQSYECCALKLKMEGANPDAEIIGEEKLEGKINYFKGKDPQKWITEVPNYEKIRYKDIYPGIDLVYYGQSKQLEHDFIVKPGAEPEKISLSIEGAEKVDVDEGGNLLIKVNTEELKLLKPKVYQEINGTQQEIESSYKVSVEGKVGFNLGEYNRGAELKIDPVLEYSTFLGGYDTEWGYSIAVDTAGNAYVTGQTYSPDFPKTAGVYKYGGDAFVTKLNASGTGLVYSIIIGGYYTQDNGYAIEVDIAGNAYVTGYTFSSDFPTTAGAYSRILNGVADAFVAKLDASGGLVYSTFLGGSSYEETHAIAIDAYGNAYVIGTTNSSNFPTTAGAYDTAFNGAADAFVTKLNASGTALVYSTFLGGSNDDRGYGIKVDGSGNAYAAGWTASSDFPTTQGAYDRTFNGGYDVFVTKLNADGKGLGYSTFIGGSNSDYCFGIAVDGAGNAYVTGYTLSTDFPTTEGAYDTTFNGGYDVFVTKLDADGTGLSYSTFIGGSSYDQGGGIEVDAAGNAYVTGYTSSSDFPTTEGAYDRTYNDGGDVFVTKLNSGGIGLVYSTFIGGSYSDSGGTIKVDSERNIYVIGVTQSYDFPTTAGAYDTIYNGSQDAFVLKLAPKCCGDYIPTEGNASFDCTTVDFTVDIKNVCAGSRVGVIAKVVDDGGNVYAIVCKTVDIPGAGCECVNHTVTFTGVVIELGCSDPKLDNLKAEICGFNYLNNSCCC